MIDMSKKARNRSREQRRLDEQRLATELKVAVVTSPASDQSGPTLTRDVELVRASVLYADRIDLVSPGAVMVSSVSQVADAGAAGLLELLTSLDDDTIRALGGDGLPDNWKEILPAALLAASLPPEVLRRLPGGDQIDPSYFDMQRATEQQFADAEQEFRDTAAKLLTDSGGAELLPAFDAGILTLSPSGMPPDGDSESWVAGWVDLLCKLLADPHTRLLLDDEAGGMARSLIAEGHVTPSKTTLRHAGEATVGSGLIGRLPAFRQAPIDELLDLRSDLRDPLVRYRAAVARLAALVTTPPFDIEIQAEVDDLRLAHVEPAMVEIREAMAEHTLVREIARIIGSDLKSLVTATAGAAVYIGLDRYTTVTDWVAGTIAAAGSGAATLSRAAIERRDQRRTQQGHELFFLYEVDRRLARSTS